MVELLWMAGKAFLIALILTPIIRDISRSYNLVDRPGYRKVHAHPMPRVGGIAIAIAYGVSLISFSGSALDASTPPAWKFIPGAALVFFIGLLDDFISLKPVIKLLGLTTAACIVFFSGLRIGGIAQHPLSIWLEFPLTVFWLLLTSNALNLIDGLDGLCAGMGLLSTLALFTAAVLHGNYPLAKVTFPLAGALLGFLVYNISPATVFLGDSGALLIGFLLGCYGMVWTQKSSTLISMLVPMLALSIPLLDVSLSVLRRFLRNQPIFSADRGHIHHRLLDRGLTPRQAVWVLYLVAALAASLALLASSALSGPYQVLVVLLFCLAAWIGIQKLGYPEFDMAGRLLFRGEFQRTMGLKLKLESVTAATAGAVTNDQWWEALCKARTNLDLVALRWSGPAGVRESVAPERIADWSLRIPLTATDTVEIEGCFPTAAQSFDLISFAAMLQRTFPSKRPSQPSQAADKVAALLP